MTDLKLLDGTVEDIVAAVASLSAEDRAALLKAEQDGKTRKGVISALQPSDGGAVTDTSGIPPASEFDPAGAPVQIVPDVDPAHPAVDDDPRANTSEVQNRIDFNDPTISGQEAVERNLGLTAASEK